MVVTHKKEVQYTNPKDIFKAKIAELQGYDVCVPYNCLIRAFNENFGEDCYYKGFLTRPLMYLYAVNAHYAQPLDYKPDRDQLISDLQKAILTTYRHNGGGNQNGLY